MLYWFLLCNMNQLHIYIYLLPLEPPSHPPTPIPPLQVITEHQAELPVLYISFPLAISFTHGSVYVSVLLSQSISPYRLFLKRKFLFKNEKGGSKCIKHSVEMQVRSLGWKDALEKEMATHSNVLAQKIPWTNKHGGLQSWGASQKP